MENTIHNIAVISFPRTGSKSLVDYLAKKYNKLPAYGVLHTPEYLGKNDYNVNEVVFGCKHILHGHWHSLCNLDIDVYNFVKENYTIVTSHREIQKVKKSLYKITGQDLYDNLQIQSIKEMKKWKISQHYVMSGENVYIIPEHYPRSILV